MSKPTAKPPSARELLDWMANARGPAGVLDLPARDLASRVEVVLALPRPEPGGHPIAIAGWNACYADVLRLLNGEAK